MPDSDSEPVEGFSVSLSEEGVLRAKFYRNPDVAMITALLERIAALGECPLRILDFRGITADFTMPEQDEISTVIRQHPMYVRRTAFLVDNPLSFARVRQFIAYREDEGIERQVFREEADALQWLMNSIA